MPKVVKDESGNDIEVFDKAEMEAATVKAAEEKEKALQGDISPNWKSTRQKLAEQEQAIKEKDAKLAELGVKSEKAMDAADVERIADQRYLERYKARIFSNFGDKREAVEKYFGKLAAGEKLDEDTIDRLAKDAARAVGVEMRTADVGAMFGRSGSRPQFESKPNTDDGFGSTEAGKSTADAMGIIIEKPKA